MADGSARLMSFVTQEQAEELKKKRQEEWEKVRKPNDPLGDIIVADRGFTCNDYAKMAMAEVKTPPFTRGKQQLE